MSVCPYVCACVRAFEGVRVSARLWVCVRGRKRERDRHTDRHTYREVETTDSVCQMLTQKELNPSAA